MVTPAVTSSLIAVLWKSSLGVGVGGTADAAPVVLVMLRGVDTFFTRRRGDRGNRKQRAGRYRTHMIQ